MNTSNESISSMWSFTLPTIRLYEGEVADSVHGNAKVHFTSSWGASFSMDNLSIFTFSYTDSHTDTDSTIPTHFADDGVLAAIRACTLDNNTRK